MAVKKSELYNTLWKSCDELRGGMDASQYKDYVLVLLFVKYISDKHSQDPDFLLELPKGATFNDMVALKGKSNIGEGINKVIKSIAEANHLSGVIDVADFDDDTKLGSGKEKIEKLSNLVGLFQGSGLNFSKNKASGDDILGDAYEYLMKNFATESGKSKGQFYTPAEVSRIMAKLIGLGQANSIKSTIYDPTCGSASLLIRAHNETPNGASIYGQEKDVATAALAKMNMIIHQIIDADIKQGNTLAKPEFTEGSRRLKTFDYIIANPPFSDKSWSNGVDLDDEYGRWNNQIGIPPEKNGDYAYLLHIVKSLNATGKGACILPHGVLFRGNSEAEIRKQIVDSGVIKGIIGLPGNLFFGTGIPACIIILDKENAKTRKGIFMIDAKEGYIKNGAKNRLREEDIKRIVNTFIAEDDVPNYARKVLFSDIKKEGYNLNIPRYISSGAREDIQDIEAHLKGGIPNVDIDAFGKYWAELPSLRDILLKPNKRKGYSDLKVDVGEIKKAIYSNTDYTVQRDKLQKLFSKWTESHIKQLKSLDGSVKPKELIVDLGQSLLDIFANDELLDKYDVYEQLMVYWEEQMQDDVYAIADDGWEIELNVPQPETKSKKGSETKRKTKTAKSIEDLVCDLLPPQIVAERYFSEELKKIRDVGDKLNQVYSQRDEYIDEHTDILSDDNLGKLNRTNAFKELKEAQKNKDADSVEVLTAYVAFEDRASELKKELAVLELKLVEVLYPRYESLSEEEIKTLVVDYKWFAEIERGISCELDKAMQYLINRLTILAERYGETLSQIEERLADCEKKVAGHLAQMGFSL